MAFRGQGTHPPFGHPACCLIMANNSILSIHIDLKKKLMIKGVLVLVLVFLLSGEYITAMTPGEYSSNLAGNVEVVDC